MKYTSDHRLKIQNYHLDKTPRIGGLPITIGLYLSIIHFMPTEINNKYAIGLLTSVFLVFLIGLFEDVIKDINPSVRLFLIMLCALFAIFNTNVLLAISYSDITIFDYFIKHYPFIGLGLSLFCVVGLTNAFNIIDGYNGLSAITAICSLITLFYFSCIVNLHDIKYAILALIGAISGFMLFNYPFGKIFLGDGGAYLIGFLIAVVSIYLVHTNDKLISPYAVLLANIYPIMETGFSIFRRRILNKTKVMKPDNRHLHHLIYHRCISNKYKNKNQLVTLLMLFYIVPQNIAAICFFHSTNICLMFILLYVIYYVISYFSILNFKTALHLKLTVK